MPRTGSENSSSSSASSPGKKISVSSSTRSTLLSLNAAFSDLDAHGQVIKSWPALHGFLSNEMPQELTDLLDLQNSSPSQIKKAGLSNLTFLAKKISMDTPEEEIRRFGVVYMKQLAHAVTSLLTKPSQISLGEIPIALSQIETSTSTTWNAISSNVLRHFSLDGAHGNVHSVRLPSPLSVDDDDISSQVTFQLVCGIHLYALHHVRNFLSNAVQERILSARKVLLEKKNTLREDTSSPAPTLRQEVPSSLERIRPTARQELETPLKRLSQNLAETLSSKDDDDDENEDSVDVDADTLSVSSPPRSSSTPSTSKLICQELWNELEAFNFRHLLEVLLSLSRRDSSSKPILQLLSLVRTPSNGRNIVSWLVKVEDHTAKLSRSFRQQHSEQTLPLLQIRRIFRGPILEVFVSQLTEREISYVQQWCGINLLSCDLSLLDISSAFKKCQAQFEETSLHSVAPTGAVWKSFHTRRAQELSKSIPLTQLASKLSSKRDKGCTFDTLSTADKATVKAFQKRSPSETKKVDRFLRQHRLPQFSQAHLRVLKDQCFRCGMACGPDRSTSKDLQKNCSGCYAIRSLNNSFPKPFKTKAGETVFHEAQKSVTREMARLAAAMRKSLKEKDIPWQRMSSFLAGKCIRLRSDGRVCNGNHLARDCPYNRTSESASFSTTSSKEQEDGQGRQDSSTSDFASVRSPLSQRLSSQIFCLSLENHDPPAPDSKDGGMAATHVTTHTTPGGVRVGESGNSPLNKNTLKVPTEGNRAKKQVVCDSSRKKLEDHPRLMSCLVEVLEPKTGKWIWTRTVADTAANLAFAIPSLGSPTEGCSRSVATMHQELVNTGPPILLCLRIGGIQYTQKAYASERLPFSRDFGDSCERVDLLLPFSLLTQLKVDLNFHRDNPGQQLRVSQSSSVDAVLSAQCNATTRRPASIPSLDDFPIDIPIREVFGLSAEPKAPVGFDWKPGKPISQMTDLFPCGTYLSNAHAVRCLQRRRAKVAAGSCNSLPPLITDFDEAQRNTILEQILPQEAYSGERVDLWNIMLKYPQVFVPPTATNRCVNRDEPWDWQWKRSSDGTPHIGTWDDRRKKAPAQQALIHEFIMEELKKGNIEEEPHPSRHVSPSLLVPKKDDARWCLAPTEMNKYLSPESCIFPDMFQELQSLSNNSTRKFVLDEPDCFKKILLSENSQRFALFRDPLTKKVYRWKRMFFGSTNAPAACNKYARKFLDALPDHVRERSLQYVDDLLVVEKRSDPIPRDRGSNTLLQLLDHILRVADNHTIKYSLEKFRFGLREPVFFGWIVGQGSISYSDKKLIKLRDLPAPRCKKELQGFLGMTNALRAMIPNYTEKTSSLRPLTGKVPWPEKGLSEIQLQAIEDIKVALETSARLYSPDYTLPLYVETDSSQHACGAMLYQLVKKIVVSPDGVNVMETIKQPISFYSWKLPTSMRTGAPPYHREAFAILATLDAIWWHIELAQSGVVVLTDQAPLRWCMSYSSRTTTSAFNVARIAHRNVSLRYIPGHQNVIADYLSRQPGDFLPLAEPEREFFFAELLKFMHIHSEYFPSLDSLLWVYMTNAQSTSRCIRLLQEHRKMLHFKSRAVVQRSASRRKPLASESWQLAILFPTIPDGPFVARELIRSKKPACILLDSSLVHQVGTLDDGSLDSSVVASVAMAPKLVFLSAGKTWLLLNIPNLSECAVFTVQARQKPSRLKIGSQIRKRFGALLYNGTVVDIEKDDNGHRIFLVKYADNDVEEMSEEELRPLVIGDSSPPLYSGPSSIDSAAALRATAARLGGVESWIGKQECSHVKEDDLVTTQSGLKYVKSADLGDLKLLVPKSKIQHLISYYHVAMLHLGPAKVTSALRKHYSYPNLAALVKSVLHTCPVCSLSKARIQNTFSGRHGTVDLFTPFTNYSLDFHSMAKSNSGNCWLLAIIDCASGRPYLTAMKSRHAEAVFEVVWKRIVCAHGVPARLHGDHAPEFVSSFNEQYAKLTGMSLTSTSGYRPSGNAFPERFFGIWKDMVRSFSPSEAKRWDEMLPLVELAVITGDRRDLGMSIHEFEHGYAVRPLGLLSPPLEELVPADQDLRSFREKVAGHHARLVELQQIAHAHLLYARFGRLVRLNADHKELPSFKNGESVLVYAPPTASDAKANPNLGKHLIRFRRGYVVIRRLRDPRTNRLRHHYLLKPPQDSIYAKCPTIVRHASLIRRDSTTPTSRNLRRALNDTSSIFKSPEIVTLINPDDKDEFLLGQVLSERSENQSRIIKIHIFGARKSSSLSKARFLPVFWDESKRDSAPIQLGIPRTRHLKSVCIPFTIEVTPEVILLRHLDFDSSSGILSDGSLSRILDLTEMPHWY